MLKSFKQYIRRCGSKTCRAIKNPHSYSSLGLCAEWRLKIRPHSTICEQGASWIGHSFFYFYKIRLYWQNKTAGKLLSLGLLKGNI